jgi:TRAP transporter TAXI family solute receptor
MSFARWQNKIYGLKIVNKKRGGNSMKQAMWTNFLRVIVLLLLVFGLVGHVYAKEWQPDRKFLTIVSGSVSGSLYPLAAKMAELIQREIPGVVVKSIPGAGIENVKSVESGQAQLGMSFSNTMYDGFVGNPPFQTPTKKIRHVLNEFPSLFQIMVPRKSKIRSISDLAGKRICPGGPIGFTGEAIGKLVLEAYGMTYEKIKADGGVLHFVRYGDMINLMQDGHLDAAMLFTSAPAAPILSMNVRPGIRLLSIEPEKLQKIMVAQPGFVETKIPAGTYEGQNEDVLTLCAWATLFTSSDLSEEMVYRITKAIFDHIDAIHAVGSQCRQMSVGINYEGNKIPVHPGAEHYYREKGVKP